MILLLPADLFSLPTEVSPHSPAGVQRTDVHGVVSTRVCLPALLGDRQRRAGSSRRCLFSHTCGFLQVTRPGWAPAHFSESCRTLLAVGVPPCNHPLQLAFPTPLSIPEHHQRPTAAGTRTSILPATDCSRNTDPHPDSDQQEQEHGPPS